MSAYLNLFEDFSSTPPQAKAISSSSSTNLVKLINSKKDEDIFCQICYRNIGKGQNATDHISSQMLALQECGHEFCIECWCSHFESILCSAASSSSFECMQTKCKTVAGKYFVLRCLALSNGGNDRIGTAYKYRVLLATDLIKESEDLQICPGEKDESESLSSTPKYTGTPQTTPRTTSSTASSSQIRLVSTISSTPTISFSYVRGTPSTGSSSQASKIIVSTPTSSNSITSTPTSANNQNTQGID